ncbi:hypothetical protein KGQ34_02045 [Patescibacteria group bacterium]|nr:hypothetical protein [Patescibacteria group bacterium]
MKKAAQTQKDKTLSAVEELAHMTKRGFDHTDERFNEVDKRFDGIENRLDRIENALIKKHDYEIADLKRRVKDLEDLYAMPSKK